MVSVAAAGNPANGDGSDKRPGAFRTISEASAELDVPQHVLRFWETRFGQIKPVKRAGGRRYYRPEDIDLLKGVHHLLHAQGYTIRGAQRVLKEKGVRFVQAVGRGDAVAAFPPPEEIETLPVQDESPNLSLGDRNALEVALAELRACRTALEALASHTLDDARPI